METYEHKPPQGVVKSALPGVVVRAVDSYSPPLTNERHRAKEARELNMLSQHPAFICIT